jgi:glyoxylase-like metal-dependent hydrolase (beta-lactamase superfamily II)
MITIEHFFDPQTFTLTYLVTDSVTLDTVIIDPVLDFEPSSGAISDNSLLPIINTIKNKSLNIKAILETHAHADHLSSSQILKSLFPHAKIVIGKKITEVQKFFKSHFNISELETTGTQFDYLLDDFEEVQFGSLKMKAIPTPGHTPACMSYYFDGHLFTGDALFMPDFGTGRCDFPKGSSSDLYQSVTKNLYSLPDSTKVYVGHDYQPQGRDLKFQTTILDSKKNNIQLSEKTTQDQFVQFRNLRDANLPAPKLLLPSIQVNINAGTLPTAESNGKKYLKIPLNIKTKLGLL